ncbi:MAG: Chemotaxis protein methyltransferase [Magnetococcales bacterium]|nr:Chemotaxis protein methyltransferase [Magnetococcales bacterium]HIJ83391.1 chemotaxis protein CheR [Magnetococcales bacterium]
MASRDSAFTTNDSLDETLFQRLSAEIHARFGILLPITKKGLLTSGLHRRMGSLGIVSMAEYSGILFGHDENDERELVLLLDAMTSYSTKFFRNSRQFEFLAQTALPELIKMHGAGIGRVLNIWSAGCATGEDSYTLAMVLCEFAQHYPGIQFKSKVLATDVSQRILEFAKNAVYEMEKVQSIPDLLKRKYLLKSKDRRRSLAKVVPELRAMVNFRQLDFMDPAFGLREEMDVIFCRNILSYFDRDTQEQLVNKLCSHMVPGGYLFAGPSESLHSLATPLVPLAPSIYRLSS